MNSPVNSVAKRVLKRIGECSQGLQGGGAANVQKSMGEKIHGKIHGRIHSRIHGKIHGKIHERRPRDQSNQ